MALHTLDRPLTAGGDQCQVLLGHERRAAEDDGVC